MPQSRRKVAFSGKKKKEQMIARRARRAQSNNEDNEESGAYFAAPQKDMTSHYQEEIMAINKQPGVNPRINRYNLKFKRETAEDRKKRKAQYYKFYSPLPESELECSSEEFYPDGLSHPVRPQWDSNMSKIELDMSENRYFRLFCDKLDKEFAEQSLSMYELNLETWRQLWRVWEKSDILLIIVDARFPASQFPPYLYEHLVEKENKGVILIMNKCDLLPPTVIAAWKRYFSLKFPKLLVVPFSSIERRKERKSLHKLAAESSLWLVDACQELVDDTVNLKSWRTKIEEERELENPDDDLSCEITETNLVAPEVTEPEIYHRYKDGILTLGTIGHPNVGKSSLINALMGKKVVSVSKTPGHTKHFQTIFLTKDVRLCDCPGLVFPSTVDVPLQVLLGSFPIAQLRDPIGIVNFIAERLNIPKVLKLNPAEEDDLDEGRWTSYAVCRAWSNKRGYRTRKGGMIDVSRGANELLRMCFNGQKNLVLYQRPPGFDKQEFENDSLINKIKSIQGYHAVDCKDTNQNDDVTKKEKENFIEEEDDNMEVENDSEESLDSHDDDDDDDDEDCGITTSVTNKFALLPDVE